MVPKYAKDQPEGFQNRIEKVAIVGAGGHIGSAITKALVATGKHTVTAISRIDSTSELPNGVKVARVDYENEASLVDALKGQQFFIISMNARAPASQQDKLIEAAAKAGVPWVMPNCYGGDFTNKNFLEIDPLELSAGYAAGPAAIEKLGVSSWVSLVCGFWYTWSLTMSEHTFGFDLPNKKATFYDDGQQRINMSTMEQCGRAMAALLSLKELPEDENDTSPTISMWRNKPLYMASFLASQRDLLDSLNRVQGTTDKDWEIVHEPTDVRYKLGMERLQQGDFTGFVRALYARYFYPNGDGDHQTSRGLANDILGLPKETMDDITREALQLVGK